MTNFTKLYLGIGLAVVALFGAAEATGGLLRSFGSGGTVDTASRQGYWYTYRRAPVVSTSRSPGSSGGSSGGYSGGK